MKALGEFVEKATSIDGVRELKSINHPDVVEKTRASGWLIHPPFT